MQLNHRILMEYLIEINQISVQFKGVNSINRSKPFNAKELIKHCEKKKICKLEIKINVNTKALKKYEMVVRNGVLMKCLRQRFNG